MLSPLRTIRHDELVDDRLRDVHEITELCFPQHERISRRSGKSVFESENRGLRQRTVVDLELRLRVGKMLKRSPGLTSLSIVQNRLAMRESSTLHVLSG